MNDTKRSRLALIAFGAVAVPLLAASIAYACGALATLSVHPGSGDAGAQVEGFGRGFSSTHGGAPSAEPVVVRFNSRSGPVLWSGHPAANGNISFSFTVPNTSPGSYTIIATQNNADGQPVAGTPARASFTVTGTPAPAPAPAQQAAPSDPAPAAAPAPAPAASASPAPSASPARATATAPRTRTATRPAPAAAPAPAVAPAPAPAPATAPEEVTAPAPQVAPAPAPALRTTTVTTPSTASSKSDGTPWLAFGLVGVGLVLSLAASAMVLGGRREERAPARARR